MTVFWKQTTSATSSARNNENPEGLYPSGFSYDTKGKQKTVLHTQHRYQLLGSDSPLNLVRTEASGTSIHMAGSTVNDGLDPLHIGLPGSVGTSVGVGNLDTEGNALTTIITLRHSLHLQSVIVKLSAPKQAL